MHGRIVVLLFFSHRTSAQHVLEVFDAVRHLGLPVPRVGRALIVCVIVLVEDYLFGLLGRTAVASAFMNKGISESKLMSFGWRCTFGGLELPGSGDHEIGNRDIAAIRRRIASRRLFGNGAKSITQRDRLPAFMG